MRSRNLLAAPTADGDPASLGLKSKVSFEKWRTALRLPSG